MTSKNTQFDVSVYRGAEGPRHDPYGYREYTVTKRNGAYVVIIHCGLAMWIQIRNGSVRGSKTQYYDFDKLEAAVKEATGKNLHEIEDIIHEREMNKSDWQREMEQIDADMY